MYVVISGNPVDGFRYYGTFDDYEDADQFTQDSREIRMDEWWIVELLDPKEGAY